MNLKIREAQLQKVPYMLVVGDAEVAGGKVAVRLRSGENRGPMAIDEFLRIALDDIAARR
jgi:threonyl-tRNA synthetase